MCWPPRSFCPFLLSELSGSAGNWFKLYFVFFLQYKSATMSGATLASFAILCCVTCRRKSGWVAFAWTGMRMRCRASHSCLPQHAWHSGGLPDGTAAHMAHHSSRAEAFSKGPGSNLKRGCLHRGQRPSGQERPISRWPLRDRHISSKGCNPSTHSLTHTQPSSSSMFSTQCSYGLLMGQRPWPWKLHKQTGWELNTTCSRLISLLFMTLFLLFDVRI